MIWRVDGLDGDVGSRTKIHVFRAFCVRARFSLSLYVSFSLFMVHETSHPTFCLLVSFSFCFFPAGHFCPCKLPYSAPRRFSPRQGHFPIFSRLASSILEKLTLGKVWICRCVLGAHPASAGAIFSQIGIGCARKAVSGLFL